MRPLAYYALYDAGRVFTIVQGSAEARKINPHRAYKSFTSRLAAEEWSAWLNYNRDKAEEEVHAAIKARIAAKKATNTRMLIGPLIAGDSQSLL